MGAPNKISIFEEDFEDKNNIVRYGINQDECVKGLIHYIRKDAVMKILNEEKDKTGIGVCEYDMGHENGRMEIIEAITNKINQL